MARGRPRNTFALRLKQARISAGYEHASDFATAMGIEVETYRRWERGETEPGIENINRILEKARVSADYLVTGQLPPPPQHRTRS